MSGLRVLQRDFQRYVLAGDPAVKSRVLGTPRVDADTRLDVYAEAYRLRLIEALSTDFTALVAFLGEDDFAELARRYIDAHPSRFYTLRLYGERFSAFLRDTLPYRGEPVLAELADFDWALTEAFDTADDETLTAADLAAVPPEQWPGLAFTMHSSVRRRAYLYNVTAIWQAAEEKSPLPEPVRAREPIQWVVWRQALKTYFRSLRAPEAHALDDVIAGASFADVCEDLCAWFAPDDVAAHAAGYLRLWVDDGMIARLGR